VALDVEDSGEDMAEDEDIAEDLLELKMHFRYF
jgi:hypothetical protein